MSFGADAYNDSWWGDCTNTYHEETKQIEKLRLMGLEVTAQQHPYRFPVIDLGGRSVLDLGGGPVSPLLKAVNAHRPAVLDPGNYPRWVYDRYHAAGIKMIALAAETFVAARRWDEVWIMNTLRHTRDPEQCVLTARQCAVRCVRVCEWIDEPLERDAGQLLTKELLDGWFTTDGVVKSWLREDGVGQKLYVAVATRLP